MVDYDPLRFSAAEKLRLFGNFSVYVTEWGSPLSYAFLNPRPAYVFAFLPHQYMRQATDATYQFNGMRHVLYTFPLQPQNASGSGGHAEAPPVAKWLARMREVMRHVPTTLTAARARDYLRDRGREADCASQLWSTCAVDLHLTLAHQQMKHIL